MLEGVRSTGQATWSVDVELFYYRKVRKEEVYITWSFAPILATDGQTVDGIFCPCFETTEKVIAARRLETLRKLGIRAGEGRSVEAACKEAAAVMSENMRDIPFAAIYVVNKSGDEARLCATLLPVCEHPLPIAVSISDNNVGSPWPLASVLQTKRAVECPDLDALGAWLPGGPWPEPTRQALVLPIHAVQDQLAGLLVVGVSPRRPLDAEYRTFFDLVAGHIATAIADARTYEAERQRAEALAELDRAKTAFFSNVSHEFRTPLTLLLGPLEDELRENPPARERLEVAHRNALRLVRLVNTLLDFSRIEAGRIEAVYEPTDIATYTAELAGVFRSAIEKAGLKLIVECPALPEPVYVDREMWEKTVLNLLSNAFKFTFEGEIKVSLGWCGEGVEFRVSDTGVGVPAAELPRIFERFHRVRGTRARTFEGTGIGLALVQELVKLHGGEIKVQSEEGRGTSFLVFLRTGSAHLPKERVGAVRALASTGIGAMPFVEEALRWLPDAGASDDASSTFNARPEIVERVQGSTLPEEYREPELAGAPQSKIEKQKSKILLADDNADMRDYVRRLLNTRFEVIAVADGEAALAAAHEHNPDLVLADVMMPRLDGFGLLKALREDRRTRNVPVIMLSARAGEESRVEGLQAGADDYLIKPFSARELLARVSARLEIARLHREALEREHRLRVAAEDAEAEAARKNEQLQEAHTRIESVLASVTDIHILFDRQWHYVYVNDAAARAIGRPREEILGSTLWQLFPDIVGTELERQYGRAMADRVPVVFDYHYPTTETWWANRFYPAAEGLAVFATDITARKRAEMALARAHDELEQRIIERTAELVNEVGERKQAQSDLVAVRDELAAELASMTTVHEFSTRLLTTTELQPLLEEVLDATIHLLSADFGNVQLYDPGTGALKIVAQRGFNQEFLDYFNSVHAGTASCGTAMQRRERVIVEDVLNDPIFEPHQYKIVAAAGYRAVQSTPLFSRNGEPLGMISTHFRHVHQPSERELRFTDLYARQAAEMIERKRVEEQLHIARSELAHVSRVVTMGELAASIAHEVNQPLAAVVTNANAGLHWLGAVSPNLDEAREALRRVIRDGNRASDVIARIRSLSTKTVMDKEPLNINQLIQEVLALAQTEISRNRIAPQIDFDETLPPVLGDRVQLQQVVLNLIINGIESMKTIEERQRDLIITTQKNKADQLRVAIKDSGIGLDRQIAEKIFDPFYTTKPEGMGMGLTISRSMIAAHDGSLWAVPNDGPGATFQFTLPI
jgi:PAS domain S-box-containing protein